MQEPVVLSQSAGITSTATVSEATAATWLSHKYLHISSPVIPGGCRGRSAR